MALTDADVSVVVPCFRSAGTIRRAVLSASLQSARPLEVILVDDGSDDDTASRLELLRAEFGQDWLRVIRLHSNLGAASARNAGWEDARGEFVALLDADDEWVPYKIERQYAFMQEHTQFAISGHLAQYAGKSRGAESSAHKAPKHREVSRHWLLLSNPMVTPSLMFRRNIPIRFVPGKRHMEDHRFLQDAVFSGLEVARIEETLAVVHKAAFGSAGLSAALWQMERGELDNYRALRAAGRISWLLHPLLVAYSLAKFVRRLMVTWLRRWH